MQLFLMRHGIAESLSHIDGDDAERPLSAEGINTTRRVAQGLHQVVPPLELVASSPKLRARETAQLVCETTELPPVTEIWHELLLEEEFYLLSEKLSGSRANPVLLVGHEPNLSRFVAWLLTGDEEGMALNFKKAGVCALEVEWDGDVPQATLLWMAPPKLLRQVTKG